MSVSLEERELMRLGHLKSPVEKPTLLWINSVAVEAHNLLDMGIPFQVLASRFKVNPEDLLDRILFIRGKIKEFDEGHYQSRRMALPEGI